ncbi:MAG TPA: 4Fe-4S binding protein [Candidatus Ornithospirochaeta stercorigallinarum]|nr:4Fe-4S binding protein [Candidatus Ornithospirochaeta stercorigallinarum]
MQYPIYTEITSCRDCYKCVRVCPTKSIQIKDGHAMIMKDRCIFCGKCVHVCPNNAKKIRDDVSRVKLALTSGKRAICSLAPSYSSEFRFQEDALLYALKLLGFSDVSETAIGAHLVTQSIDKHIRRNGGECNWIGTACPSVVELVKKYYPDSLYRLAPVPSPLQCHSAYLRKLYGEDIIIVFIGPCAAKKHEADMYPGYPDYALTFVELKEWLKSEGIDLDTLEVKEKVGFIPAKAGMSSIYPIEGGQITSSEIWGHDPIHAKAVALSGMDQVLSALGDKHEPTAFLELLGCDGGCVNGPGTERDYSIAFRKKASSDYVQTRLEEKDLFKGDDEFTDYILESGYGILGGTQPGKENSFQRKHSEDEIKRALVDLGKLTKADELNCGGCGYPTCREMAIAYLDGMAEVEMCVTKMRKEAQSKVDVLLRTIPMGVVIVDSDLKIADCNVQFLDLFGDMEDGFVDQSMLSMVRGLPVERFVPFADKFKDQFYLSHPGQYRMHYKDKFIRVTFFLVEKQRLLGAMFDDITNPTIKRETVVKKAEDVIQKSLETVQQIASLLGENAAETEIMLNSLIDAFSVHSSGDDDKDFTMEDDRDIT